MKLSIVILNYNTKSLLKQTLDSIRSDLEYEIIVVDNASTDGSVEMLKSEYIHVITLVNQENYGFAKANNLGLKKARGEYILILNSDTIIKPGALEILVNYLDHHQEVGAIGPKLILSDGQIDPASHRGLPTFWNAFTYYSGLEKLFPRIKVFSGYHQLWKDISSVHSVDALSMAAMMIRKQVVKKIGLLDEQFFMYAEDLDYCHRIRLAGWLIVYHPDAVIVHLKGQSGTYHHDFEVRKQTRFHFYNTMKLYYRKHYGKRYPQFVLQGFDRFIDVISKLKA